MFASASDRLAVRASGVKVPFVVRFVKNGRESELAAESVGHALALNAQWIEAGSEYVEIFRVMLDGSLNPTIGAHRTEEV